jgi:dolichol-phosphate mannosyltransferase
LFSTATRDERAVAASVSSKTALALTVAGSPRLSIVIPTRNEAANVHALRNELEGALAGIDYEVVIVDDSNDTLTRPILEEVAAADRRWRIIARPKEAQTGLGTAVVDGIHAARGEAVCVMDGDLQHPPSLVPELLAAVDAGADLAVASRYMPGGSRAGLEGRVRRFVSRGATWIARGLFPEARKTTDPLTGFFCCRRRALRGLEYRPLGFKVLLEVLVCGEDLAVTDVPLAFQSRFAGESKATAKQGLLYLHHVWSLFMYVPGSARTWKFLLISAISLAVFFPLLATLHRILPWMVAWALAAAAGTALSVKLHRIFTFRDVLGTSGPGDESLYFPLIALIGQVGFAVVAVTLTGKNHPWLVLAAVSQAIAMGVIVLLNRPDIRRRFHAILAGRTPASLDALGKHLGATWAYWIEIGQTATQSTAPAAALVLLPPDVVARVAERGRPTLWVEPPSARRQPRVNIEMPSAILIPSVNSEGRTVAIAILVRYAPEAFGARQLQQAIAWLDRVGRDQQGAAFALPAISELALAGPA